MSTGVAPLVPTAARPGALQSRRVQGRLWLGLVTAAIALGSLTMVAPVLWMLTTSFKHPGEIVLLPPKWIPIPPHPENYAEALRFMKADVVYRNTVIVTGVALIADVLSAAVVAFGFARLRAPGKNLLFMLVLSTLMIPYHVRLIPEYLLFAGKVVPWLKWTDTFLPLIVPPFFGNPLYIFLLRQFYQSVPLEMDDAAKIDGASYLQILTRIMIPLSLPALGTISILSFVLHWNDFFRPLIYLSSREHHTVAIALRNFQADFGATPWHLMMAASMVALVPVVVVFFLAQRYFVQGVVVTGLKG